MNEASTISALLKILYCEKEKLKGLKDGGIAWQ